MAVENLPAIDIGIITIKQEEFSSVVDRFKKWKRLDREKHSYIFTTIESLNGPQYNVAVSRLLEQGTGSAQSLTVEMIEELNPAWLFLVGIAGGIPSSEYSLGDVLLCTKLYDFSICCTTKNEPAKFAISGGPIHRDVARLLEILPAYKDDLETCGWNSPEALRRERPKIDLASLSLYGDEKWKEDVIDSLNRNFSEQRKPKYYLGPTGSSNNLVKDDSLLKIWQGCARDLTHVEMELAGVYRAAQQSNIPVLSIRSLSDIVGYKRSPEWTQFACDTAASFAICLIRSGIVGSPREFFDVPLITNLEYFDFSQISGYPKRPRHWSRSKPYFTKTEGNNPVTWVSWDDAVAYCDWMGGCLPGIYSEELPIPKINELGEWRDAGNKREKVVYNPHNPIMTKLIDREKPLHNVGFRCVSCKPISQTKEVFIDGGLCRLGTDIDKFKQIAYSYNLPADQSRPILRRLVKSYKLHDFKVLSTCVTNEEYFKFTKDEGKKWPSHWNFRWLGRFKRPFPARLGSMPVVNINAIEAQAYCRWSRTRLPDWKEWERVASGLDRRSYPWGDDYCAARCNSEESGKGSLAAVNEYSLGDSPEGVRQLCGNVAEWVRGHDGTFEIRGGSYLMPCELWGLAYVFREVESEFCAPDVGFRVVFDS